MPLNEPGTSPTALSLDAGGVLLLPDPNEVRRALEPHLVAAHGRWSVGRPGRRSTPRCLADERLLVAHYAGMLAYDRPAPSAAARTARYRAAYARALGLTDPAALAALARCFAEPGLWSAPAPGARAVVRRLAARRIPIVVVSNTEHGEAAALLARAGLWPRPQPVEAASSRLGGLRGRPVPAPARSSRLGPPVVDSARVGIAKPDPAIFRLALDVLGLPPERLIHVGDSAAADVAGAEAAGIRALHLDPLDRCPDRRHGHLAALAELLEFFEPAVTAGPEAS